MAGNRNQGSDEPDDVDWARQKADADITVLREGAERWRNAVATATGVVGAALVFKGDDPAVGLSTGTQVLLYVLLVTAVVAGILASYYAVLASTGRPTIDRIETTLQSVGQRHQKLRLVIIRRLRIAVALGALMVALIIVSVGLSWFLPRSEPTVVRVERMDGRVVCGEFVRMDNGEVIVGVLGHHISVPRHDIRLLGETNNCN